MNEPKEKSLLELVASIRIVGFEEAAKGQLEQALFLWFHKDDLQIVSDTTAIHTLAVAVQGVLWTYAHDSRQRPSAVRQKIEKMAPEERARLVDPQNFFKHGHVGRKEKAKRKAVSHLPDLTDFFLVDDISCFNRLFKCSSALMEMFLLHYALAFPKSGVSLKTLEMKLVRGGEDLQSLAKLGRREFYELVAPYAVQNLREQKAAHSASPPKSEKP